LIEEHAPERAWGSLTYFVQTILDDSTLDFTDAQTGQRVNGQPLSDL
jgi:hypothetical protein